MLYRTFSVITTNPFGLKKNKTCFLSQPNFGRGSLGNNAKKNEKKKFDMNFLLQFRNFSSDFHEIF